MTVAVPAGTPGSVAEVLDRAAATAPDAPALVVGEEVTTFSRLRAGARALAGGLRSLGVGPGDHVAVWMPNGEPYVRAFYAAAYAGAVLVPMNTWHTPRELGYCLAQSDARVLLAEPDVPGTDAGAVLAELLPRLGTAEGPVTGFLSPQFPQLRAVVVDDRRLSGAVGSVTGPCPDPPDPRRAGDPAYILYTSGTTGAAKGVVLPADGVLADATLFGERLGITSGDRYYCPVPLFHAGGAIFVLLAAHVRGAAVVTHTRFDPVRALAAIRRHGCRITGGFEVTHLRLLDALDADPGPVPLEAAWWVGPASSCERVEKALGARLMNLYGMTEASGNVTATPLDRPLAERATTMGVVLAERVVEVVDPSSGEPVPAGEAGEIRVSGWGLMSGYYRMPDRAAEKLDERGRLRTGDLGTLDDDGVLRFAGRADDALKVGGENVAPQEVEEVLTGHPAVEEIVVAGVPDPVYGHAVVAAARLRPGAHADGEALRAWARERLASYKVPRRIAVVDDFPRTSTGKIRRREVAARLEQR
ncbi:Long-chain-fatty-acid--CoA ligase [Pseudonocardia sp. Ae168_Ps1]|uniref:class I adenylate-forming enzyme family protein n=1 Tax=unclassified Pseudonocardia TaxID=2619320 RepID=UPI000961A885|nr:MULTISPECIES: AMP-binding protein [unclassified Pseudonocardia]OLL72001.1 Long-chain-fatty-acid--CoA ligase [Pseudonocardia sp. Ae150A_Ps1]OLL77968.1 Long-chain-fatty-acid--CoA ligase [Pseudonocardia sp. Ae168_Ps1]OLL87909.1 Long-chain-fatty-acid--CoA ligase [Pseudonocardia sp. Ae263_Ps1]OLL92066.1 Long-chain-fatty-acid--CoA ligase [Pseudonocardia sp. Ae356_Ps1]